MTVCIIGNGLTALTLAKTLVNKNIYVDLLVPKKEYKLSHTRTLGISKTNSDFFNRDIISIEKLLWKLKRIEIFSENLKKEKLINFENKEDQLFSMIKNHQLYEILKKSLLKNKFFKKKISNKKNLSFIKNYSLIINCDSSHPVTKKYFNKKIIKKYSSY
jgi:2-octaprenyl-6-methoxyphenol hydroxylase